jgi:hypothetical protein
VSAEERKLQEGFILADRQMDPDRYQRIAKIPMAIGACASADSRHQ